LDDDSTNLLNNAFVSVLFTLRAGLFCFVIFMHDYEP